MVPEYQRTPVRTHLRRVALALVAIAALSVPFTNLTYAQSGPIPKEIRNLKMGSSTAEVTKRIKSVGTFVAEPSKQKNRTMLVWTRPHDPYYKNIAFEFTEKDRLFLIRFTLNDAARADYHSLKRTVFKDYDFSWERPQKLSLPTRDMLLYGPEKGMELYYIEFTDKKSHERSFELFDRSVSATDRPEPISFTKKRPPQTPKSGQPSGQAVKPPTGETRESAQPPKSGKESLKPTTGEKRETAKPALPAVESQKPATGEKADTSQKPKVDTKPDVK